MKIFLATGNKKKIDEMSKILSGSDFEILSIKDGIDIPEVIEDGETFEENSRKKALEIAKFTNMITISDDSGLCVEALDGEPGVYSARYAGEDGNDSANNKKLIENLKGIENRKAKFVTVITLGKPNGESYSFRGEIEGIIVDEAKGENGFGYDPHFYLPEYGKTFAEMPEIKNQISHRAKALQALKNGIDKILNKNSRKKALEIAKFTNMITISDDSGLCVEALDGEPGVYSARYAGEDGNDSANNKKLIENLKGIENRKAKFVTVITLGKPNGESYSFRGEIEGIIVDEAKGENGFGYDPHFYLPEYGKTFAEMPEIKNQISHRAKALQALKNGIDKILNIG